MSNEQPDLPEIFAAALKIRNATRRAQLIDELTGGNKLLQAKVQRMIEASESADVDLSIPPLQMKNDEAASRHNSIFQSLSSQHSCEPVFLRDDSQIFEPVVRPSSNEIPSRPAGDRYQLYGEIARGGMGAVLKGMDTDLGRNLAIKVLLDRHKDNPEVIQRFVEEAQIGGQLQHPGIAPVYELGEFEDRRPYFTMKLVNGETLAAQLSARLEPNFDRARYLGIFEQVCQTMAYAHTRGVVHRDLKPANIMVGAFGEVQVMDWGVAKVLSSGGIADERKSQNAFHQSSSISSSMVGTGPVAESRTVAGSLMGTPPYMPPEQALGDVEKLDERCDVFGLGAILCEILTGKPPYVHVKPSKVLEMATHAMLDDCMDRLDACAADPQLIALTMQCLSKKPSDRPRNAGVVADAISNYLATVETRLRESEIQRAAEASVAIEERKRYRVTTALAGSIFLFFLLGMTGYLWFTNLESNRADVALAQVNEALDEARLQRKLAASVELNKRVGALEKALTNANGAGSLSENAYVTDEMRHTINGLIEALSDELEVAYELEKQRNADQMFVERFAAIKKDFYDGGRSFNAELSANNLNLGYALRDLEAVFKKYGINVFELSQQQIVERFENSEIKEELIAAFDQWSSCLTPPHEFFKYNPWARAYNWNDAANNTEERAKRHSYFWTNLPLVVAATGDIVAYRKSCQRMLSNLAEIDDIMFQENICRAAMIFPDHFTIDQLPTDWFKDLDNGSQNLDFHWWRAEGWTTRALLESRRGNHEKATSYARKSLALTTPRYNDVICHSVISLAAANQQNHEQALENLNTARREMVNSLKHFNRTTHDSIAAWLLLKQVEKRVDPDGPRLHCKFDEIPDEHQMETQIRISDRLYLGSINEKVVSVCNDLEEKPLRRSIRKAISLSDIEMLEELANDEHVHFESPALVRHLAMALGRAGKTDVAVALLRAGQRNYPTDFALNYLLGKYLIVQRKPTEGLAFCRAALAIRPNSVGAQWATISANTMLGNQTEASIQLGYLLKSPNLSAKSCRSLAIALSENYGNQMGAIKAASRALEIEPDDPLSLTICAVALFEVGRTDEALAKAALAVESSPNSLISRIKYVELLVAIGERESAIQVCEAGCRQFPKNGIFFNRLGTIFEAMGRFDDALEMFKRAKSLSPDNEDYQWNLATVYGRLGRWEESESARKKSYEMYASEENRLRDAVAADPNSGLAYFQLAKNLFRQGKHHDSVSLFRDAVELNADNNEYLRYYGMALFNDGQFEDALNQWRNALKLVPESPIYAELVGKSLVSLGRFDEAEGY